MNARHVQTSVVKKSAAIAPVVSHFPMRVARDQPRPRCANPRSFWGKLGASRARRKTRSRTSRRIPGRPTRRGYVHRFATKRRCQRSSVVGVIMKDRQRVRGRSWLAAANNMRSMVVIAGRRGLPSQDGELVPQHDDFQLLEGVRAQPPRRPAAGRGEGGGSRTRAARSLRRNQMRAYSTHRSCRRTSGGDARPARRTEPEFLHPSGAG